MDEEPYEPMSQEDRERMQQIGAAVLERMTKAGWIESARNKTGVLIEWTPAGNEAAKQLGSLFSQLGDDLNAEELVVLRSFIETMSIGGGADAEENRV
jgi:DNA-binding MarR family transcriptional regulator